MLDWTRGYTQAELDIAQERFNLRFPPDLVELLREKRPRRGYDWRTDEVAIRRALDWPLEGLLFDVENNELWWPEWGSRPDTPEERAEVLAAVVTRAPPLVPILGHRYIPSEPHLSGNPVFSVYQADVIYYGADLADYFQREIHPPPFGEGAVPKPTRRIPFWSDLVDRN